MKTGVFRVFLATVLMSTAAPLFAGFGSTETYLAAVGRVPGQGGAQFYTTVWASNLTTAPQTLTFRFLRQGQANPSPASFQDTLAPGETKVYENVVESKLGLSNAIGAARVTSTGEIFVSERIYNQAPGDDVGKTEGLFFAGVPKGFSISAGQSASIQGIDQGSSENFRYNFALIETGGGSPTVNVQVFDGDGTLLGQKAYPLLPYEQIQPGVADVVAGIATTNARITATVTAGTGSVLLAGAQLANESQDSSGFEMTFRDDLLGSSSGGGLTALSHDGTLKGDGTAGSPLGINPGAVVTSLNGLHGGLTLSAGSNVTITPNGSTLTIASSGAGSGNGLTLPYSGTTGTSQTSFAVSNTGGAQAIEGDSNMIGGSGGAIKGVNSGAGNGVYGTSDSGDGVAGFSNSGIGVGGGSDTGYGVFGSGGKAGVEGTSEYGFGLYGENYNASTTNPGVYGKSPSNGVLGESTGSGAGVRGTNSGGSGAGVYGTSLNADGVLGQVMSSAHAGVSGSNSGSGPGIYAESNSGSGIYATSSGGAAVYAGGNLVATGTKSFIEPHPTDPTKEIRYVCLEGRESGTYFRGTARTVGGFATIGVPEDFRMVTSENGLTVQLTALGAPASLWVVSENLSRITVQGSADIEFHYLVNGIRKAFEDFEPVAENRDFVPGSPGDERFVVGLPAESVRRLKANGIVNADGSINLETAHRLGWDQRESWKRAEERRTKR
jgi:hypothetical protein